LQNIQINGKQQLGSGKRNQNLKTTKGGISSLGGGVGPVLNSVTGLSNQNLP
jgi:hypothetical protein